MLATQGFQERPAGVASGIGDLAFEYFSRYNVQKDFSRVACLGVLSNIDIEIGDASQARGIDPWCVQGPDAPFPAPPVQSICRSGSIFFAASACVSAVFSSSALAGMLSSFDGCVSFFAIGLTLIQSRFSKA